jgi:hypothetical protein
MWIDKRMQHVPLLLATTSPLSPASLTLVSEAEIHDHGEDY